VVVFVITGAGLRYYLCMTALRVALPTAPALLVLLALAPPSRAEAGVGLFYRGPDECPSEAQFVAAVDARGGRFDRVRPDDGRAFDVSIRRSDASFHGSLQVRGSQGTSRPREVHAASCNEVVDGLAVVTAIALRGESDPAPAPRVAEAEPAGSAPTPAPTVPAPSPPAPATPPEDYRLHPVNMNGIDNLVVSAGTLKISRAMTISVSAGAVVGVIPKVTFPRYDLSLTRANFITPPDGGHFVVGNVIRVRLSWLMQEKYRATDATTDASGFSFAINLCHSPYYNMRGAVVLLCAEYGGGFMKLDTRDTSGTLVQSKTAGLGTVGANTELQYNLGRFFHLDLRIGGDVNLTDVTAERADGSRIFKSQPFSAYAVGGLGFNF
jgi:hypothetical protein